MKCEMKEKKDMVKRLIEHSERREKELHIEFMSWLDTQSALDIINFIGLEQLEQIWLADRLKKLKKEYGVN